MSINKTESGWHVDIQPGGRGGKRFRKKLPTKAEALAYEAFVRSKVTQAPEWAPTKRDLRRLSDLVAIWHKNHGRELRAGVDTHSRLKALCVALGDPFADQFKTVMFTEYRSRRIAEGITPSCLNREHAYLRAVFNELKRLGEWKGDNPLSQVQQFKVQEQELSFLSLDQIRDLLNEIRTGSNIDTLLVTKICLATGARWSESEALTDKHVRGGQVHYNRTKSGKNRSVPISDELHDELQARIRTKGEGRLFNSCYESFRGAIERTGIVLPKGQMTHVLRHTFASHFMMNGGNILALQKLLGHANLTMTMRYAHLSPEHLQEAKTLNPLARLTVG